VSGHEIDPFPEEGLLAEVVRKLIEQNPDLGHAADEATADWVTEAVDELGRYRTFGILYDLWATGRATARWDTENRQLLFSNAETPVAAIGEQQSMVERLLSEAQTDGEMEDVSVLDLLDYLAICGYRLIRDTGLTSATYFHVLTEE
jgi:hypothetical protein